MGERGCIVTHLSGERLGVVRRHPPYASVLKRRRSPIFPAARALDRIGPPSAFGEFGRVAGIRRESGGKAMAPEVSSPPSGVDRAAETADRSRLRVALGIIVAAQLMIILDGTVMN